MARQQVGYNPGTEVLRPTVSPNYTMVQPQSVESRLSGNSAYQLAAALGSPNLRATLTQIDEQTKKQDEEAARAFANSKTINELGDMIKNGELAASRSPAFVATVQHIYGENTFANFENDTLSKINKGELKFDTQEDLDQYITSHRNDMLEGQSKYTVAGYDKRWNQFRDSVSQANFKMRDAEVVDDAVARANDNLWVVARNTMLPDFKGTKDEAAAEIMSRYKLLTDTALLRDDQRKAALANLMSQVADSGDKELVNSLLNHELDNGITVGAVLGGNAVNAYRNAAEGSYDKAQHQRIDVELRPFLEAAKDGQLSGKKLDEFEAWVKNNEQYVTTGTYFSVKGAQDEAVARMQKEADRIAALNISANSQAQAQQTTAAAVENGQFANLPALQVYDEQGDAKSFNSKEYAENYLINKYRDGKAPLTQQVQHWSTNDLVNPEWKKAIQSGITNIASLGWTPDGKHVGELNEQGQYAFKLYNEIAKVNPAYAAKLAEGNVELFEDIKFMNEHGYPNLNDAAAIVNQGRLRGVTADELKKSNSDIVSAIDDLFYPWGKTVNKLSTFFSGNQNINMEAMRADISRRSRLLLMTGQYPDASSAVEASTKYIASGAVSTVINNTLYYNKDLPTMPPGQESRAGTWMERFIAEVPAKIAISQKFDGSRVRLEKNASGGFVAMVGNHYLTDDKGIVQNYTREQIQQWIRQAYQSKKYELLNKKSEADKKLDPVTKASKAGYLKLFGNVPEIKK